jgi:hypothetical protein
MYRFRMRTANLGLIRTNHMNLGDILFGLIVCGLVLAIVKNLTGLSR